MNRTTVFASAIATLILAGGIGVATAQMQSPRVDAAPSTKGDPIIWQEGSDALIPPRMWDCERIVPEYRDWIEAGNAPEDWKYVGQPYRDETEERNYNWQEWLDWHEDACPVGALPGADAAAAGSNGFLVGLAANLAAISGWAILTADSDDAIRARPSPNDSPG